AGHSGAQPHGVPPEGQLLRARARARRDARGAPWRARSRPTPPLRSSAPRRPPRRASCGGTMPAKEDKKNKKDQGFMLGPPFLAFLAMAAGMSYIFLRRRQSRNGNSPCRPA
ncbi:unnamed protein product, partial [Prorocentrum cordatum]